MFADINLSNTSSVHETDTFKMVASKRAESDLSGSKNFSLFTFWKPNKNSQFLRELHSRLTESISF